MVVRLQILSQYLLIREDVDVGYFIVELLPILNCEVQRKLVQCRDAITLLRRTQVKIFNELLGVVENDKPLSSDKLSEPLGIYIMVPTSMNDNTDVVQEKNSLALGIDQHEEVAKVRYVREAF